MIRVIMIVEMMGKPAEHLKESMKKHSGVLEKISGVEVDSIEISEPKIVPAPEGKKYKPGEELYTLFAECEFEVDSMSKLTQIMFDFMPSSVEIVEPANIGMPSNEATDFMNNICGRLHRYDEFARVAGVKIKNMNAQLLKAKEIIDTKDKEIEKMKNNSDKKKTTSKKVSKKIDSKKKTKK